MFKAKESAGKSGSFFFFSHDKKFLLKTMNDHEMEVFKGMLPSYLDHFRNNPKSLLARIYGVFTVKMEGVVPVHILLMSNAAQCGKMVEKVFDLKGSEINRNVKEEEINSTSTLKDLNLINLLKDDLFMLFQTQDRIHIMG